MIVIELEEKQYGKSMEAITKIKQYVECLAEMFEENSLGYRRGMSHKNNMGYKKHEEEYQHEYPYGARFPREYGDRYKGDYGERYM